MSLNTAEVLIAENGQLAIEQLEKELVDVVLMDIQMPVMDGYTATQEVRKNDKNATLPIIAMTANAMSGDREKCIAAGMNEHLAKPINPQEMYSTLAKWVEPTGKEISDVTGQQAAFDEVDLPCLPEFDLDSALARMAGNVKAYRKTLMKVVHSEADAVQRIRAAIDDNDYPKAVLVAHTLKGVAGNIGAKLVIPSAEQLELLFTARVEKGEALIPDEVELLLIECEVQLAKMVNTIESDQQNSSSHTKQKSFDIELMSTLLADLKDKIDCFDSAASETLHEILNYVNRETFTDVITKLENALESYDFDKAELLFLAFEEELNSYNSDDNHDEITEEALLAKLDVIGEQIANFDSTVVDAVDDLLDFEHENSLFKALEKVRNSLSGYDFDTAEEQLNKIKAVYFNNK